MDCVICSNPNRRAIEERVITGASKKSDIAQELECFITEVVEHFDKHLGTTESTKIEELKKKQEIDILYDNLYAAANRLDAVIAERKLTKQNTDQIVSLMGEIRKYVLDIKSLKEVMQSKESTTWKDLEEFRGYLIRTVCSDCRKKLQEKTSRDIADGT